MCFECKLKSTPVSQQKITGTEGVQDTTASLPRFGNKQKHRWARQKPNVSFNSDEIYIRERGPRGVEPVQMNTHTHPTPRHWVRPKMDREWGPPAGSLALEESWGSTPNTPSALFNPTSQITPTLEKREQNMECGQEVASQVACGERVHTSRISRSKAEGAGWWNALYLGVCPFILMAGPGTPRSVSSMLCRMCSKLKILSSILHQEGSRLSKGVLILTK